MNFWVFLVPIISWFQLCSSSTDTLQVGKSLSVNKPGDVLVSKNGIFSAGFYSVGVNAVCFAIWVSSSKNPTVVWMQNRDEPINGKSSKLSLLKHGDLILIDGGDTSKNQVTLHSAEESISNFVFRLQLLNNGNLALFSNSTQIVWQSFDSPTDTLLPNQPLGRNTSLTSPKSETDHSKGYYKLTFDNDNVLRLLYDGPEFSSPYWPEQELVDSGRSRNNFTRIMVMDSAGHFISSDFLEFYTADAGSVILRILKLDYDGNLRVYSLNKQTRDWVVSWQAIPQSCAIRRSCGPNSLCSYIPDIGKTCTCLPGYKFADDQDLTAGCVPKIEIPCENNSRVGFLYLSHVDFYGFDMEFRWNLSFQDCKDLCKGWCQCKGFRLISVIQADTHIPFFICYFKNKLLNGYYAPSIDGDMYVKLPEQFLSSAFHPQKPPSLNCSSEVSKLVRTTRENKSLKYLLWFAIAVGSFEMTCIFLIWCCIFRTDKDKDTQGYLLLASKFRKFSYAEMKKATNGFSEEIGRGGGGVVYKGILSDKRIAAIKQLDIATNQGEAEFLAEVTTIGNVNHMNLIEMWGYCAEGKHRLLVYEYMEHGSLAANLSSNTLNADKRFEIALGTARGLAYLHEESLEWVLHCDVKPQNILLGSNFQPKVADFGLSRLLNRGGDSENVSFSRMRGTRGYMAPEWVFNLPITSKVDVYSYGIVVLEMVTGHNPTGSRAISNGPVGENNKRIDTWVRQKIKGDIRPDLWIEEIIDPRITGPIDVKQMEVMVRVALRCVEEDRDTRPTMGQVVEMLTQQNHDL